MKILFVAPLPEPITGQSLACSVLHSELTAHHEVEVVNLSKPGFKQGVNSFGRIREIAGKLWEVWRRRRRADVIYFTIAESRAGNAKDLLIYLLCLGRLDRMLIHLHGGAGMRVLLGDGTSITARLNRWFLKRLGGVIVLGERHRSMFDGMVAKERLHIVQNFAEDEMFTHAAAIDRKFAHTDPLRILFLSNLLPGKGHRELVEALGLLAPEIRNRISVEFAGGFESESDKAEFLESISNLPQANYHGSVRGAAKLELFHAAHAFCLPTYYPYEGQPISILEAYASGCAVITTDHSGIFDVFTDGSNGYAVEKKSGASLARALEGLVGNPADALRISQHNLAQAKAQYRTKSYNARIIELLNQVQGRGR